MILPGRRTCRILRKIWSSTQRRQRLLPKTKLDLPLRGPLLIGGGKPRTPPSVRDTLQRVLGQYQSETVRNFIGSLQFCISQAGSIGDDSRFGHIPHEYFEESQRTLSTIIVAGTFMAGVEAQLVTLSLSSEGKHEANKTISICFGIIALFSTAFAALYSAATYIWLKQDWEHGPKRFEEWVAASMRTMIRWCSTFLVAGVLTKSEKEDIDHKSHHRHLRRIFGIHLFLVQLNLLDGRCFRLGCIRQVLSLGKIGLLT